MQVGAPGLRAARGQRPLGVKQRRGTLCCRDEGVMATTLPGGGHKDRKRCRRTWTEPAGRVRLEWAGRGGRDGPRSGSEGEPSLRTNFPAPGVPTSRSRDASEASGHVHP